MIKYLASKKGMTLLELLIAAGVLIVAISGLMATFINFQYLSGQSRYRTIAMEDAAAIVERIRNISPFTSANVLASYPNGQVVPNFGSMPATFNEQATVSYTDPAADPMEVVVTVRWLYMRRPMSLLLTSSMTYR